MHIHSEGTSPAVTLQVLDYLRVLMERLDSDLAVRDKILGRVSCLSY